MNQQYQKPTGTRDVIGRESWQLSKLVGFCLGIAKNYGYSLIDTPIFEKTPVFLKVGESSDIVQKERYRFTDQGGEDLTLRPEGTASVARAVVENGLYNEPMPLKLCYAGPMFRRERPQANRYRQFLQFGIELYGSDDPKSDAEVIDLARALLSEIGLNAVRVHLNSIGCTVCRPTYREALIRYYRPLVTDLCEDCQRRLDQNPLRLLDCKIDLSYKEKAPKTADYLCAECDAHFTQLQHILRILDIQFDVDPFLVRGLDYYTRTVFEVFDEKLGAMALLAGGRYNGLLKQFDGPDLPAVGFACGLERLLAASDLMGDDEDTIYVAHAPNYADQAMKLAQQLRGLGLRVEADLVSRSMKAQMRDASKRGRLVVIVGREYDEGHVVLKDLTRGEQKLVAHADLPSIVFAELDPR